MQFLALHGGTIAPLARPPSASSAKVCRGAPAKSTPLDSFSPSLSPSSHNSDGSWGMTNSAMLVSVVKCCGGDWGELSSALPEGCCFGHFEGIGSGDRPVGGHMHPMRRGRGLSLPQAARLEQPCFECVMSQRVLWVRTCLASMRVRRKVVTKVTPLRRLQGGRSQRPGPSQSHWAAEKRGRGDPLVLRETPE